MPVFNTHSLVLEQLYTFMEALTLGAVLAAFFDIYRAARRQGFRRPPAAALFIVDCLFWILASFACLATFIVRRWGEVHLYTYMGLAVGTGCYFYFFSRFLYPAWNRVFSCLFDLIRKLYRCIVRIVTAITAPLRWALRAAKESGGFFVCFRSRIIGLSRRKKA